MASHEKYNRYLCKVALKYGNHFNTMHLFHSTLPLQWANEETSDVFGFSDQTASGK